MSNEHTNHSSDNIIQTLFAMMQAKKTQYNSFAHKYASVEGLPCSKLEGQLVQNALGDYTGIKVLGLGGGSGLHARRAIDAGAIVVDVVDITPEMLRAGQDIETPLGRRDRIRWLEGCYKADYSRSKRVRLDGLIDKDIHR
jgi:ubiquinone/menaquinone biosynthesis C-methylase UbiE